MKAKYRNLVVFIIYFLTFGNWKSPKSLFLILKFENLFLAKKNIVLQVQVWAQFLKL
jgi:hypothetical protein